MKDRACLKKDCTFVHLKNTRRHPEPEEPDVPRNKQKLRFDSLASISTPYPPTIQRRVKDSIPSEVNDSQNSFLLQLIENLKEGIVNQVTDKLTEFQSTIPMMVKEQLKLSIPVQKQPIPTVQSQMNLPVQNPMTYAQMAQGHLMNPQMYPMSYPACSF